MKKNLYRAILGSALLWSLCGCSKQNTESSQLSPPTNSTPEPVVRTPQSIVVSYRGLVDMKQVTQEGATVGDTLTHGVRDPYVRGQLQPFLEKFSRLLPDAVVAAQGGSTNLPHVNVLDELPKGAPVPAWASLLKGGAIVVTDDGDGKASVFAPGETPQFAFSQSYGIIRHVLQALLPEDGRPLQVSTYAFTNDYGNCQLRVSLAPFLAKRTNFGPPPGKAPLNLESLSQFFQENAQLEGGSIDSSNNLILVGKRAAQPTLAGQHVELSDLAAAYRAVFHSGDNLPYISLDPHTNHSMVNVNFGGYLEDTRIGSVVLESDKRFKTITSGLDPTSFVDLRKDIRRNIPTFSTVGERDLLVSQGRSGWEGTRFWFYPDSVEVQTSLDGKEGVISKAQFTADAERSRDDYASSTDFNNSKKAQLSPAIRMNIDDLNRNYSVYASVFPELSELSTVARLMGLCIWLQKNGGSKLDLDALLSVPLPDAPTQREKKQLVTALSFSNDKSKSLGVQETHDRSILTYLTPMLDKSVNSVFPENKNLAEFLAVSSGYPSAASSNFLAQAAVVREYNGNSRVSELITNKTGLEAFAMVASDQIKAPEPESMASLGRDIDELKSKIEYLKKRIQRIEAAMDGSSPRVYNSYVGTHNQMVEQERQLIDRYNFEIDQYNQTHVSSQAMLDISGGIGLEPSKFKVISEASSPELENTKKVALSETPSMEINGEEWVKSNPSALESAPKEKLKLSRPWKTPETHTIGNTEYFFTSTATGQDYWRAIENGSIWHDQLITSAGCVERYFDISSKTLQLARFENGQLVGCVVAKNLGNTVIFSKSDRANISVPSQPPHWWN